MKNGLNLLKEQPILMALLSIHQKIIYERHNTEEAEYTNIQKVLQRLKKDNQT